MVMPFILPGYAEIVRACAFLVRKVYVFQSSFRVLCFFKPYLAFARTFGQHLSN